MRYFHLLDFHCSPWSVLITSGSPTETNTLYAWMYFMSHQHNHQVGRNLQRTWCLFQQYEVQLNFRDNVGPDKSPSWRLHSSQGVWLETGVDYLQVSDGVQRSRWCVLSRVGPVLICLLKISSPHSEVQLFRIWIVKMLVNFPKFIFRERHFMSLFAVEVNLFLSKQHLPSF